MIRPLKIVLGVARWLALLLLVLAAVLQAFRPDILSLLTGAMLGPRTHAIPLLYLVALGIGAAAFYLTPREQRNPRKIAIALVCAMGLPLAGVHVALDRRAFGIEEVEYPSADGTPLVATLYRPRGTPPYPAVVVVHGSPPVPRGVYDIWADRIARRGFVVLVADKRGVGDSGGEFDRNDNTGPANIARLSSDVVAGVDFLSGRPDVRSTRIGLFGVSQAGWVGTAAAAADSRVSFLAMITAPAVSTREEARWSQLRGDDHGAGSMSRRDAERVLDTLTSRGVDARVSLAQLRIPSLWLFGDSDNSVPTLKSIRVLDSLRAKGVPVTYRKYDGFGHALIGRGDGAMVPRMAPSSWGDLFTWLDVQGR